MSDNIGIWFDYITYKGQYVKAVPKIVFPNYISINLSPIFFTNNHPQNVMSENIVHKQFKKSAYKKYSLHKELKIFFEKQRLSKLTVLFCKFIPLPTEINYIVAEFI